MGQERRKHPRVRTKDVAAHVHKNSSRSLCSLENLSVGGAFVRTSEALPVGTVTNLTVVRPGMKRGLQLTARVTASFSPSEASARGAIPGMGLQFQNVDSDLRVRLEGLLRELGSRGESVASASLRPEPKPEPRPEPRSDVRNPFQLGGRKAKVDEVAQANDNYEVQMAGMMRLLAQKDVEITSLKLRVQKLEALSEQRRQELEAERLAADAKQERQSKRSADIEAGLRQQLTLLNLELSELRRSRS